MGPYPVSPANLNRHIIAARNLLVGTSYFLILALPKGWHITRSYLEPDVHSNIQKDRTTWVEAGQADQIIFQPLKRIALDLMIQIKRGRHDRLAIKGVQISSQGQTVICGHQASYCTGVVKQGLFKKKSVDTLRFSFYCPDLNRSLFLHFTGNCPEADLLEIHEAILSLECH